MCVTDRNPEFDPADIRGAARSDDKAVDADTGEDLPGNYPTHDDGRERANTCATCWQEIPDGRIKCPHCASNKIREPSDGDDTAVEEWTFGRVVVAVVPGNSTYHARALGASAFDVSDSVATGPDVSHGEVKLRADFATAPVSPLTDGWPDLPPEAPIDEPDGTALFETAIEASTWDGADDPRIYREDGSPVTSRDELKALEEEIDAADEQYWAVPGIVQRYEMTPDLSEIDEPLYCVDCGSITGHEAAGRDSIEPHPHRGRPIWACTRCGQPCHGPDRDSDEPISIGYEHLPDNVSPEDIHGDEPDFEKREFHSQIGAYRERHGCFPWEQ